MLDGLSLAPSGTFIAAVDEGAGRQMADRLFEDHGRGTSRARRHTITMMERCRARRRAVPGA
jgi:hypothetical protein